MSEKGRVRISNGKILSEAKGFLLATLLVGAVAGVIEFSLNLPEYTGLVIAIVLFLTFGSINS
ncbi:hypothetical protein [Haloferax sp. Atlit-4N]|uniref:hypothetical protein n=1 Tax=Haloferax sp. Atlit-4N TaxID=2077206 RepID=UPI0011C06A8F|nr:hypothetical protein [Haloferax sp. Atlit-4N]